jgi:hypothetical protein
MPLNGPARLSPSPSTLPPRDSIFTISFEESECITRCGSTRTTFLVLVDRSWQPVQRIITAITRVAAPSPGVVWRRFVEVPLPVGTQVEKLIESPERAPRANTSDVLFGRSAGLRRQCRRVRLVVAGDGRLLEATRSR